MADCRDTGIIALAPNDWHGQWVNRQQLLSRLGHRWPIVYSTGAWTVWDRGSNEWRRAPVTGGFSRIDNVWVDDPPRWLLRWPRLGGWDKLAISVEAKRLRRKLAAVGARRRIAYLFHPLFLPYLAPLDTEHLIYHAYDLFDHQPNWNDALEAAERELLKRADLVLVPSEALGEELRKKVDRPIHVLLNAADVPAFLKAAGEPASEPADLVPIPRPRIGYMGSLHPQLDYSLLRTLAERRPHYHWVMVGPRLREKDLVANADFRAFAGMANVHILGSKSRDAIPSYTVNTDVNVMVYKSTETSWTKVAYPLKLHEYLASGRPIVTMELPMLRPLDNVIRFAQGADDWVAALDEAIASGGTGTREARQAAAAGHSWDVRSSALEAWLRDLVADGAPAKTMQHVLYPGI